MIDSELTIFQHLGDVYNFIDDGKRFGYLQVLNNRDQLEFKTSNMLQNVIIIDTKTNYFNATRLCETLSINNHTIQTLLGSKIFIDIVEYLETIINTNPPPKPSSTVPNYDLSTSLFKAKYTISKTKLTLLYYGVYLHPSLLMHVVNCVNPLLSFKFSQLMFGILVREGINKSLTLSELIKDNNYEAIDDIGEYVEIADAIEEEPSATQDIIERAQTSRFDLLQHNRTKSYNKEYAKYVSTLSSTTSVQRSSIKYNIQQAIVVIAHYEPNTKFAYNSGLYKLSIDLINASSLKQYFDMMKPTKLSEQEYESSMLFYDKVDIRQEVICRFDCLHNVPYNYIDQLIASCNDNLFIAKRVIDSEEFIITDDVKKFESALSNYLFQFMDY